VENPLRLLWTERNAVGTWCALPSSISAEILAGSGFDWVCIDWQHGFASGETLASLAHVTSAGGAVPIVRVPFNEPWLIQKALDVGSYGVIVPLVNTRDDATRAVAACRYPPAGTRSYGPIRASEAIPVDPVIANRNVLCIVQIETPEAVDNVEAIAATGVDALFVGPNDLSISSGLELGGPEFTSILQSILDAGRDLGVPFGRHCDTPAEAREAFEMGFRFIAIGSDLEFIATGAAAMARDIRSAPGRPASDLTCRVIV
jgi:4-hydroxy-2-oxoheptanedioate aldolase